MEVRSGNTPRSPVEAHRGAHLLLEVAVGPPVD